jgi:thiamine biosynthesis lipoprotein
MNAVPTATPPSAATSEPDDPERIVGFAARALGSPLAMHVRLANGVSPQERGAATDAWDAVQAEFGMVDAALSRFREDSELTALNRLAGTDRVVAVSWRLRTMLAAVHRAARLTDGRFDGSVLGVLERIGEHGAPLDRDWGGDADAPAGTTLRLVPAGTHRASLVHTPPVPVDSGGIGKGLALRWAVAAALRHLPNDAGLLVDAGGDIACGGSAPTGGWRVGVEDPLAARGAEARPIAVVALERGAVATSSVRVRNWTAPDGRRVHHIVDPRTGAPARTGLIAVTVAGLDPAWSEVWSKALFLAGRDAIGPEARARGLAAWWVDDSGRTGMTPEARLCASWIAEERIG